MREELLIRFVVLELALAEAIESSEEDDNAGTHREENEDDLLGEVIFGKLQ